MNPVEAYLTTGSLEDLERLHEARMMLVVDWRADEQELVDDCATLLRHERLSSSRDATTLVVRAGRRRAAVPLAASAEDRCVVVAAINRVLRGEQELRSSTATGGDTHGFLALPPAEWSRLTEQFGDAVARHFAVVSDRPAPGGGPVDDVLALLQDPAERTAYTDLTSTLGIVAVHLPPGAEPDLSPLVFDFFVTVDSGTVTRLYLNSLAVPRRRRDDLSFLGSVAAFRELRVLAVHNHQTLRSLAALTDLLALEELDLRHSGTSLDPTDLALLAGLPHLRLLRVTPMLVTGLEALHPSVQVDTADPF